jgi:hypothetical protein
MGNEKESGGTLRGRVNVRGFKQIDGHRIVLSIMLMQSGITHVIDVEGAFLYGKILLGFEKFYSSNTVLLLKKMHYSLKPFYRKLLVATQNIRLKRSTADPCLYYKWGKGSPAIMISWINDNMILGHEDSFMQVKANLMKQFECDDCGRLKEYIGNKIKYVGDDAIQFVQTVLLQS